MDGLPRSVASEGSAGALGFAVGKRTSGSYAFEVVSNPSWWSLFSEEAIPMTSARKRQRGLQRRDATGHLDPKYAADLRLQSLEHSNRDESVAFLGRAKSSDSLAEALGEEFVEAATTGEDAGLDALNQGLPEDEGGPFVLTRGRDEFARGRDPSNPKGATREPFPKVSADAEPEEPLEPPEQPEQEEGG
jgi:hypothetical protein